MEMNCMSIKDLAKEVFDDKRDYNAVRALIGPEKAKELRDELSVLFGAPFLGVDTPEGIKALKEAFGVEE